MDEYCKYEGYDKYEEYGNTKEKEDKKPRCYKKDECGEIKIYTHTVNIHINCKESKY